MSRPDEREQAHGLLHDLDDIRSLLDEAEGADRRTARADGPEESIDDGVGAADDAIPVLEDVVSPLPADDLADATADLPDAGAEAAYAEFTRAPDWENLPELLDASADPRPRMRIGDGTADAERMIGAELDAAISARIDAALEHWINDTLQVELALLRARLQDAVKTEIEAFLSRPIDRANPTGRTHGE